MLLVNIGCGATPTRGWTNFDNSLTVRLAGIPGAVRALARAHILAADQVSFAETARRENVRWANAVTRVPLEDGSVRALYSSHMFEHLDATEAARFLYEARRVLKPGGILRLVVPDLAKLADTYRATRDADAFVQGTFLTQPKPRGVLGRARTAIVGNRHHHWMYDGSSLLRVVTDAGFVSASVVAAGTTRIPDPGELDLFERSDESVYVEAETPAH